MRAIYGLLRCTSKVRQVAVQPLAGVDVGFKPTSHGLQRARSTAFGAVAALKVMLRRVEA